MQKNKNKKKKGGESESEEDDQFEEKLAHYNYKLILVGSSEVGKTSITNRYVKDMFNDNELHSREVQIEYKHFQIPDTNPPEIAELHIWDTLGQEKFKSVVQLFFRGSVGAFLVFDLSKRSSFDELQSWHSQIEQYCDKSVIVTLVGNKCDLPNRQVTYDEAMDFAKSKKINYMEVSAKTGQNVQNLFNIIVINIYKQMKNISQNAISVLNSENQYQNGRQEGGVSILQKDKHKGKKKKRCCI